MTRALWTFLGRGFLVLALTGFAVGCGDDDDDEPGPADAGTAGKGGSGGRGGSGGKGGTGGTPSKQECATATAKNTKLLSPTCVDCACGAMPATIAKCDAGCWNLFFCVVTKCADKLGDQKMTNDCAEAMCADQVKVAGAAANAMLVGPVISGPTCAKACAPAPRPDAGMPPGEDAGVDAGN